MDNNNSNRLTLSIKVVEKNVSKTYTDSESNIKKLEKIAAITNRSFNEVLKELVNDFLVNGNIYDTESNEYYKIDDIIKMNDDDTKDN